MKTAHYLRVVRALAIVAALPACTSVGEPDPAPVVAASDAAQPSRDTPPGDASTLALADAANDVDAGYPFSSGPIVPPELPVGFA